MASVLDVVQSDDYVEYFLFPEEVPNERNQEEALNSVLSLITCTASEYKHEYIWHKDPFNVSPVLKDSNEGLPSHLHGITYFGDNIEDEWFIVFLLLQLTIDVEGLIVRVVDSDGEFLLIEAADFLPSWADPETCGQRVYLYQGAIHFVPFTGGEKSEEDDEEEDDESKLISVASAIQLIRSTPEATRAPQPIQDAIKARIEGYPGKIRENLHRSTLNVPAEISAMLKDNPSLIASAVRAFCERDPIDKRACRDMAHFRPENCVMSSVVFTRCLYAMLCHDKAVPEKRSGWSSPPPNAPTFKMHNLGFKVACGFEILIHRAKTSGRSTEQLENMSPLEISDLSSDRGWLMYLGSLQKKGYFKDLLEGSKDYKDLLERAKEFYVKNRLLSSKSTTEPSAGHEILLRLGMLKIDLEAMKNASKDLPQPDDDSWLEITPEDVDSMLKAKYGSMSDRMKKDSLPEQTGLASVLGDFLDYMSGVEGAEFPNKPTSSKSSSQTSPLKEKMKKLQGSSAQASTSDNADNKFNFDPDGFSCAVQNILDFVIPEDSWDLNSDSNGSDIGSYEDDGELDLDEVKPAGKSKRTDAELKQYMDQMDRELANTTLAESFERKPPKSKAEKKVQFSAAETDDSFDDVEDFQPVDIDMNALKNILESYQSQMGAAGPASNLLGPMGVHLETLSKKPEHDKD